MEELIYFSSFSYRYIESFVFLEVARRGAVAPLNPSVLAVGISNNYLVLMYQFSNASLYINLKLQSLQ